MPVHSRFNLRDLPVRPPTRATGHLRILLRPLERWHLLSLDAPSVAALWTCSIAAEAGLRLPLSTLAAMFLAVWTLYAGDRLLDAQALVQQPMATGDLQLRHLFHHRHRSIFLAGMILATAGLIGLLPVIQSLTLHLFLGLGVALAAYFVLLHGTARASRLPKEAVVGVFFAAAIFIPSISQSPRPMLSFAPLAALFGALCCMNCLCIHAWEHPDPAAAENRRSLTRFTLRHLRLLLAALLVASFAFAAERHSPNAVAIALAAAALLALHQRHAQIPSVTLRAAADLVLLTPLLVRFH